MKFCEKCGKELNDDAVVCMGCGCAVPKAQSVPIEKTVSEAEEAKRSESSPLGIVGMILGIAGIAIGLILSPIVGIILGVVGIVLSVIGKKKCPEDKRAKIGLIISVIAIPCGIISWLVTLLLLPLLSQMLLGMVGSTLNGML